MMLRAQLLAAVPCGPRLADTFIGPINSACHEWEINTSARRAAFVAQCAHETLNFALLHELWGPTPAQLGYEGRADLGNIEPGDGRRFLGRGLTQITGRSNYAACSRALYGDTRLVTRPELLEDPIAAARSAGWFWHRHGLNELADTGDFLRITKIINGGTNGLEARQKLYARALAAFAPVGAA